MTAGSVDLLTKQRIIENHVIGVYPEWIATGLGIDPDTVREITAAYDEIHHPDRRMTIEDRAARLSRSFRGNNSTRGAMTYFRRASGRIR